jgi:hypothetical protein
MSHSSAVAIVAYNVHERCDSLGFSFTLSMPKMIFNLEISYLRDITICSTKARTASIGLSAKQ